MHAVSVAIERAEPAGLKPEHLQDIWPGDAEAFEEYRGKIREIVQEMGVCSFSAIPNHLLMWSHYANHHRGFCVEYDCRDGTLLRKLAHKVRYKDAVQSLSAADFAPPNNDEAFDALWLTKAECWSYEKEWRVMMSEGNKSFQAPSDIISVIFGTRMPEADRVMIARALRHNENIQFKEALLKDGTFLIEIVDT